jgi:hypothetical protein
VAYTKRSGAGGAVPTVLDVGLVIDRARYDALAALPWQDLLAKFPGIAAGPHVSMLRWTLAS